MTKSQVTADAAKALSQFPLGWRYHVWENLGWHYCIQDVNDSISVYASYINEELVSYHCLVGRNGAGEGFWSTDNHSENPLAAARHEARSALTVARQHLALATQACAACNIDPSKE